MVQSFEQRAQQYRTSDRQTLTVPYCIHSSPLPSKHGTLGTLRRHVFSLPPTVPDNTCLRNSRTPKESEQVTYHGAYLPLV